MSAKSQLKKNRNIFILVCFYGLFLSAQEDSARYYLKSKLPIITRIQKCMKAAYLTMNYETSVTFYNKLTALPEIGQNPEYLCMAANELANNAGELGKLNEATAIMKDAVEKTKDQLSDTTAANSYYFLSYLYFSIGDYEPAVSTCFTSLQYSEKSGNKRLIGAAYNNLGLIYSEKSSPDFKKALEYFLISEKLLKPFKHPVTMGLVYLRIGDVLSMQNEYAQAEKYFAKALRIGDSCNRVSIQKWTLEKYGKMLRRMGNRLRALEMMKRSVEISERNKEYIGQASTSYEIASLYMELKDFANAAKYADSAIVVSNRIGQLNTLYQASKIRADVFELKGDYKNALGYFKKHKFYYDSLNKNENLNNINELEQKYKTKAQEKELLEKEKLLGQQQADITQQQVYRNYFVTGLIALTAFLLLLFKGYQTKQRTANLLTEKNHLIEEKNKEILGSISYAKRIQGAILPSTRIVKAHLPDSFILYKPKDIVAGDFYWIEQVNDIVLFAAADCTGHGVPGAMVSVVCNNALNRSVREYGLREPGKILDKTRQLIIEEFEKSEEEVKDGMDISIVSFSRRDSVIQWAGANNPLWIIKNGSNEILEIKPDKQPIGQYANMQPFKTHQLKVAQGDSIYVFTDGYQDQFGGEKGKKYKASQLKELLLNIKQEEMDIQKEMIEREFENWKGLLEQVDDVTIIGVRV